MIQNRHRIINGKKIHVSGWIPDRPDPRDKKMSAPAFSWLTMTKQASLRPTGWLSRIEDQQWIGSCTANAATDAFEFIVKKAGKDPIQLSRLFTYAVTRTMEGTPLAEDSGAQIRTAIKSLAKFGSCLESLWPYNPNEFSKKPSDICYSDAMNHQAQFYYRCPSLRTIKASIAQGFPVVGGFACPQNMFSPEAEKTGVIKMPGPDEGFDGGHAVLFTGFNDETRLLEFKNSWGSGWGDGGFGFLPYDMVNKGYADDFWTIRLVEL